ncbi:hypothetical protein BHM03_00037463 [Ensete ventricosum]|nr:hypothetical protein BHM03_00037463 [Ensete ventricosum]
MNDESQRKADLISRFVGMYVLVHSSNNLAVKSIRDKKKFLGFLKSCLAFSEVTIPSISDSIQRMNLYLETAEVISS